MDDVKSTLRTNAGLILAAGFLLLFVSGGARFAIGLTLKPMVEEFGWGRSELGSAVGVFQIVSAISMFVSGRLVDRISLRAVLQVGIVISAIGIGLMSELSAPWHALLLYGVVFAMGNGVVSMTPVGVMVTRAFPGRAGLANAIVMSGMSVGQLIMVAVLAAVLAGIGWRSVFLFLGFAHLLLLPIVLASVPGQSSLAVRQAAAPADALGPRAAARTRQFWLLLVIYAICGFNDFFVATHVVAFAQDRGVEAYLAGNLLALMGLTGLLGVVAAGAWSDRSGPVWATAAAFAARVAAFALIALDQSTLSVALFALLFGATFLVTAPMTLLFVRESFGTRHLGTLTGLITMIHHICGGFGAYLGASVFDRTGRYDLVFALMLASSVVALCLTLLLRRTPIPGVQFAKAQ
ncbi:MAG TPA: MFS transporter [Micropepsaceae bacterium]|nr:MFS transporter [Micropepsaceae bacterium]